MSLFDTTWSLQVEKMLPPVLRDADFILKGMDFELGNADNWYIYFILVSAPGAWKEKPIIGVAIFQYLQGTQSLQVLQRNIRQQLEIDIFKRPLVNVANFPTIIINENRPNKVVVTLT